MMFPDFICNELFNHSVTGYSSIKYHIYTDDIQLYKHYHPQISLNPCKHSMIASILFKIADTQIKTKS